MPPRAQHRVLGFSDPPSHLPLWDSLVTAGGTLGCLIPLSAPQLQISVCGDHQSPTASLGAGAWLCPCHQRHPGSGGLGGLTKVLHAVGVRVIQEEVPALDSPVHLEAEPQAGILHQLRVDLVCDGLGAREGLLGTGGDTWTPQGTDRPPRGQLTSSLLLSRPDKDISSIFICSCSRRSHTERS